jgi:hypothetical protein
MMVNAPFSSIFTIFDTQVRQLRLEGCLKRFLLCEVDAALAHSQQCGSFTWFLAPMAQ